MLEFILSIFYFVIFCLIISKIKLFSDDQIPKNWFITLFGIKIIFSILFTVIYTNYYTNRETADIFKYFDDSQIMFDALKTNPIDYFKMLLGIDNDNIYFETTYYNKMVHWYRVYNSNLFSDSHTIIRFNALVRIFSFGHFQVHNIFINFISLVGLTAIFKTFKPYFIHSKKALFYSVFLIPSVLFWGSGLLKEGILLFALGLFILSFFRLIKSFSYQLFGIIVIALTIIIYTKFYIAVALIPSIIGYIFYKKIFKQKALLSYCLSTLCILIISISLNAGNSKLDPFKILINKQADFIKLINRPEIEVNSNFSIPIIENQFNVIKSIPNALLNTFIRPYVWESYSPFILLNALENLFIILLFIIAILFRKKNSINKNTFYFCITYVVTLFTIIGITTPIFGAIARYKVPGLPFLIIASLLLIDFDFLRNKYPLLNKIL